MKYCVKWNRDFEYLKEIDEVILPLTITDIHDIMNIQENENFLNKRIIFEIILLQDFLKKVEDFTKIINTFKEQSKAEIAFLIHKEEDREDILNFAGILKRDFENCTFFIDEYANNWDTLWELIELGVSDIYVTEALGFELKTVANVLHPLKIKIRVFPNVAQSASSRTKAMKKFFIRPEDTSLYEPYVDVFEFWTTKDRLNTYFRIYAIEGKWIGSLNELIRSFHTDKPIDNKNLLSIDRRINCGKRCLKGVPCNICEEWVTLSDTLYNNDLMLENDN